MKNLGLKSTNVCTAKYGTKKAIRTHMTTKHKSKKKNDGKVDEKTDENVGEKVDEKMQKKMKNLNLMKLKKLKSLKILMISTPPPKLTKLSQYKISSILMNPMMSFLKIMGLEQNQHLLLLFLMTPWTKL